MSETLRIAHFADSHLGYRALHRQDQETGRNQRTIDVDTAFTRTIDAILAQRPDAIIHSGDVFHHARPTWQSLRHFIRQMRRIEAAGIPTLVIAGNHDTPRIRTGGSAYSVLELALPTIRFATEYDDVHETDAFAGMDLHVHAIPHGALTNPDRPMPMTAPRVRNVLVSHGMVAGILSPGVHTEPGEIELDAAMLPANFDYIAFGHYHVFHQVAANAWYCGATERFGWGDRDATPGFAMVTLDAPGDPARVEHVPIDARPMIALPVVNGENLPAADITRSILKQLEKVADPTAMVRVDLRSVDRQVRREVERSLRRTAEEHVWSCTLAAERPVFALETERPSLEHSSLDLHTLFAEFVASRTGPVFNDTFAAAFLERGSRALTDAAIALETPNPEGDTLA